MAPRPPKVTARSQAQVAPAVVKLKCATCGASFERARTGGRLPKYCPEHRRKRSQQRGEIAAQMREEAERRDVREQRRQTAVPAQVSRMAAGLRVYQDVELAAKMFGVTAMGADLTALAELARATHPKVIAGDMSQTALLAQAAVHVFLTDLLERRAELPARDLPQALKMASIIAAELTPDGAQHNFTAFHAFLTPPPEDGRLTPEQRAIAYGDQEPDE